MTPGWEMGVLHQRTRTIKAGPMVYVECYPIWGTKDALAARREARSAAHKRAQDKLNERNAKKKLVRLVNANFGSRDLIVTLEYAHGRQPGSDEQAQKDAAAYMRRIAYLRKKRGLEAAKYIYIAEKTHSRQWGERWHIHVIMSGGITREEAEGKWRQKHGGIANAKLAQPTSKHLTGFAQYMVKNKADRAMEKDGKNPQEKAIKRRWVPSKNLHDPDDAATTADKKISIRKAGRAAEAVEDFERAKEIFAKLYPECELLEISAKKSAWAAGVYIAAELRRKEKTHGDLGHDTGDRDGHGRMGRPGKAAGAIPERHTRRALPDVRG